MKSDARSLLAEAEGLTIDGLAVRAIAVAKTAGDIARRDGDEQVRKRAVAFVCTVRRPQQADRGPTTRSSRNALDLSPREREVAELAAGGLTDREIAAQLIVSVRTIESHLSSVYRKLAISTRHEVAAALPR